jgi:hypothetical protein
MDTEVIQFFKTLVDVERLKIAGRLALGEASPAQLSRELRLREMDVVHHLERLEEAGMLVRLADGERFSLDKGYFEAAARRQLAGAPRRLDEAAQAAPPDEQKIVLNFTTPDGRLKQIPQQAAKLRPILNYVITCLESGQEYTEKEVNQRLSRFHEDTAALRRYLVDFKMLGRSRDGGRYWRL